MNLRRQEDTLICNLMDMGICTIRECRCKVSHNAAVCQASAASGCTFWDWMYGQILGNNELPEDRKITCNGVDTTTGHLRKIGRKCESTGRSWQRTRQDKACK